MASPAIRWLAAVRPIWQDEATELREVKHFTQGHTAHLLSELLNKRVRPNPKSAIRVLGIPSSCVAIWYP